MNTELDNIPDENNIKLARRVKVLENAIQELPSKEDVAEIVHNTMKEVLFTTSKGTKAVIITTAVIVGSLAVIGGGIKFLLGIIGFHYLGK